MEKVYTDADHLLKQRLSSGDAFGNHILAVQRRGLNSVSEEILFILIKKNIQVEAFQMKRCLDKNKLGSAQWLLNK